MFFQKMLSFTISCFICFLQTSLICCNENSTAIQFSVPEDHHICLRCDSSGSSEVIWTHQDRQVLVSRQGSYDTNRDRRHYVLLSDGGLCVLQLDDSDEGLYRCNQLPVAELQVITGPDFTVAEGRTLLLPCGRAPKPKQRWFHRRKSGRREAIFTRYKNGTAKAEGTGSRLSFQSNGLQIQDLQPEDAGEYHCNGELQGRVTVITVHPEPTSIQTSTSTSVTSAVEKTVVVEIKKKKKKTDNAVLMVAISGLGLMILLMFAVCVLLTSMRCRRKRKHRYTEAQRHEDAELQPWSTSITGPAEREALPSRSQSEETIHYASLGHHNWRERPSRTPGDQDQQHVIYSSVITRPAVK